MIRIREMRRIRIRIRRMVRRRGMRRVKIRIRRSKKDLEESYECVVNFVVTFFVQKNQKIRAKTRKIVW
jgi:hypothetical protein